MDPYKLIVFTHVLSGAIAFVVAPFAMMVKKGGRAHRRWGKIFFRAMTFVVITGAIMSYVLANIFLFCVAFFSYYLVVSGYRWLYRKKNTVDRRTAAIDWAIAIVAAIVNIALVVYGIAQLLSNGSVAFAVISLVFGLIGLNFTRQNLTEFRTPPSKQAWLYNHIGGMLGGYIATVSAFSAVNLDVLPIVIRWLWPTVIGVPLMLLWIGYYRKKFSEGKKPEGLVVLRQEPTPPGE